MRLTPLNKDTKCLSEILEIEILAARHGVELILSERGNYLAVQWIKRHRGDKGAGAEVMKSVCRYADSRGLVVMLSVMDAPTLETYYEQFGFEGTPDPLSPREVDMKRKPRKD